VAGPRIADYCASVARRRRIGRSKRRTQGRRGSCSGLKFKNDPMQRICRGINSRLDRFDVVLVLLSVLDQAKQLLHYFEQRFKHVNSPVIGSTVPVSASASRPFLHRKLRFRTGRGAFVAATFRLRRDTREWFAVSGLLLQLSDQWSMRYPMVRVQYELQR
jgi:hypothetical protein